MHTYPWPHLDPVVRLGPLLADKEVITPNWASLHSRWRGFESLGVHKSLRLAALTLHVFIKTIDHIHVAPILPLSTFLPFCAAVWKLNRFLASLYNHVLYKRERPWFRSFLLMPLCPTEQTGGKEIYLNTPGTSIVYFYILLVRWMSPL